MLRGEPTVPYVGSASRAVTFGGPPAQSLSSADTVGRTSGVAPALAKVDGRVKRMPAATLAEASRPTTAIQRRGRARVATCLPRLLPTLRQYWTL